MILLIDNYDSFTWNLVQEIGRLRPGLELGRDLVVVRNDALTVEAAEALDGGRGPSRVLISPGPCGPGEAGVSAAVVRRFAGHVPVLGVCLGHQVIGECFGMRVTRAARAVHGKTSVVLHDGRGVFAGAPSPMVCARYHSLVVEGVGEGWEVSAWAEDDVDGELRRVVMGLRRVWNGPMLEGVQFHPESFLTEGGGVVLGNFLKA
ncbi:MAG TPA: aminodeoxychorismate/anthranilate synthase component II [Phycisphaerales bacterium]|nr:aminodeoxychorismate/anthranilate synthase component II [Phycisphaerales bacterium]